MNKPKRIQRSRAKGWKFPPNAIYVGRPSEWGNPYEIHRLAETDLYGVIDFLPLSKTKEATIAYTFIGKKDLCRHEATKRYKKALNTLLKNDMVELEPLRGKDLVCWCPLNSACHADILLRLANKNP